MQSNKFPSQIENVIYLVVGISIIAFISLIITILFFNIPTQYNSISNPTYSTQTSTIYSSPFTISPIGEEITSITASTKNQSFMVFDGVNDFIQDVSASLDSQLNETSLSASVWFRVPYNRTDSEWNSVLNDSTIFWIQDDSPKIAYQRSSTTGVLYFKCSISNGTSGNGYSNSTIILTHGEWNHILCNHNVSSNNLEMYYNGVFSGNVTTTINNKPNGDNIHVGKDDNIRYFLGAIDEVRIYNKSLTATEISEIYNSGRSPNSSLTSDGLVVWYAFNENNGTVVYDLSGNGNNAQ